MPRPRLYLDECVDHDVVPLLARRGLDVLTARIEGVLGASDERQLAFAAQQERVIVTHNVRDFRRLHRQGISHTGIFLVSVGAIDILDIRIALFADWITTFSDYHSQLFRWHELQQRLIQGERIAGYSEADVRRALGHAV